MAGTTRLQSLDMFRGLVMFLLVAEGTLLYEYLSEVVPEGTLLSQIVLQFHHHPWNGLRFWDLVQPFFMFIVGTAMWFSVKKRTSLGQTQGQITRHIVKRCVILLAFGVGLHIGYSGKMVWELWNVLSQLSVTILIAYAIMRWPARNQVIFSLGLLLLTELLYRFTGIEGFDQPFVKDQNFGSFMDMVLMGKLNNGGGWVAINAIPTAAHTIWGVLAGKLLDSDRPQLNKVKVLLIAGFSMLVVGYGLDWVGFTPIIKRICTTSFVIASGGWSLMALAGAYWLIDVKKKAGWITMFVIVGMNPIFIYLFMETVGREWLVPFVFVFTNGIFSFTGLHEGMHVLNALVCLGIAWYLTYWLYKRKIFIKI
jgi:predicted acyltransferase